MFYHSIHSGIGSIVVGLLMLCFTSCQSKDNLAMLRDDIYSYTDTLDAEIGVAVLTDKGDSLTVHNEVQYPMMSVFKFHQAIGVAHFMSEHHIPLSDEICIYPEDMMVDMYSPMKAKYSHQEVELTIADLLQYTLQWSDNVACDILFDRFYSPQQVDSLLKAKTGIYDFEIRHNEETMHRDKRLSRENWSNPYATVQLISQLMNDSLVKEPYATFLKETMMNCSTGQSRLSAPLLASHVKVGHKTGTGFENGQGGISAVNDVGFVELSNGHNYAVAVYIKDSKYDMELSEKIIAEISDRLFKKLSAY